MSLDYDKINISINGDYILAESIGVSQSAGQRPAYILGNISPLNNIPEGLRNNIDISYTSEINKEPNYKIISGWKNTITGQLLAIINIGELVVTGFLTNYSFSIVPNSLIKSRATYSVFTHLTGNFSNRVIDNSSNYNALNTSGLGHYWSAEFKSNDSTVMENNILQLDYSFQADLLPNYSLGKPYPCQISTLSATELINVISKSQNNPKFSGQNFNTIYNIDNLTIKNISSIWHPTVYQISFNLSGFASQNSKMDSSIDNLILFKDEYNRFY